MHRNQSAPRRLRQPLSGIALCLWVLITLHTGTAAAACGSATIVADETELSAAITAFNAETDPSCVFSISLSGDIPLNLGLPDINNVSSSLIIEGNGFAVDAQDISGLRPFAIQPNTTVTMNDLTVTGGNYSGGGFTNKGGGINNRGILTLNRTTVSGNTHSDQSGPWAPSSAIAQGGGIANSGTLTIDQSTISNNVLSSNDRSGAGIYAYGNGSQITITNSTISGHDDHAIFLAGGDLTLDSVTITDTEYGLYVGSILITTPHVVNITNSILESPIQNPENGCFFPSIGQNGRVLNDGGHNLVSGGDSGTCGFINGQNGNITLLPALLGPLADNGGPTQTHAPLLGSSVLDAGNTSLTEDQRGHPRPQGSADDIGAYEDVKCLGQTTFTVGTAAEWFNAIDCFNSQTTAGTYTIQFVHSIGLGSSSPLIDNSTPGIDLLIQGDGYGLEGGGADIANATRLLEIAPGTEVAVEDLMIMQGRAEEDLIMPLPNQKDGGAILNRGDLTIRRSTLTGNTADRGGAIFNASTGALTITTTIFWNNFLTSACCGDPLQSRAGAVYNDGGNLLILDSTFSGNTATEVAGIVSAGGAMTLDSVTVTANDSGAGAAAVYVQAGAATLNNNIFGGNTGGVADIVCDITPAGTHNLAQTQQGCFTNGVDNNIVGQDPQLQPLADNGGPTRTHALLDTSPAYDSGETFLTVDQREHPRPSGAADDRGAFELASTGTLTIHKDANPADGTNFDFSLDGGTLGEPILFQLADGESDTHILETGQYTVTETDANQMGPRLISCSDANGPVGSQTGNTLTIDLQLHEAIDCTFFNEPWYTVEAVAVGNGAVSCSPTQVWKGERSTCTAVPDPGYQVTEWTGDCVGAGANTQCFLAKITKNQSSQVIFEAIPPSTYTVTANVDQGNGSVSCSPNSVTAGGSSTCTAVPLDGYAIDSWGGACAAAGSNTECYLSNITTNQTSTVSFVQVPPTTYTANVTGNGNGTVVCTPTSVAEGGTITCTATPDVDYQVIGWTGDCAAAGNSTMCVIDNVHGNVFASVSFFATAAAIAVPLLSPVGLATLFLLMLGSVLFGRRRIL
jgi:hypothetical protein